MLKEALVYTLLTTIVLATSSIFGVLLEMSLFIIYFYSIKVLFSKQFHADTIVKSPSKAVALCFTITFLTQFTFIFILVHFELSFYTNIYLGIGLGLFSYILQDYLESKFQKIVFFKGMKVEDLPNDLVGIEYEVMKRYYVDRYQIKEIASDLGYGIDNIKKIKAKIIKRYS